MHTPLRATPLALVGFIGVAYPAVGDDTAQQQYARLEQSRELASRATIETFQTDLLYCQRAKTKHQASRATTWEDASVEYGRKAREADDSFEQLDRALEDRRRRAALALDNSCKVDTAVRCINIVQDLKEIPRIEMVLSQSRRLRVHEHSAFNKFLDCVAELDDFKLERGIRRAILQDLDDGIDAFKQDVRTLEDLVRYKSADY